MEIYIYHGNPERKKLLEGYIKAYYKKVNRMQNIESSSQPEEATAWIRKNGKQVDILFLDCTDQTVAVNLASQVRNDNQRVSWVYVDGNIDGLCEALLWRPSAYLENSADAKQIVTVIHRLDRYHRMLQKKNDFSFKFEGEYKRIPFRNISYFESSAKKVTLHLRDRSRTYYFTAKLEEIQKMLPDSFLRCHQSYLVNLDDVRSLDIKEKIFVMSNNDEVLISRRQYTASKERYEQFLKER